MVNTRTHTLTLLLLLLLAPIPAPSRGGALQVANDTDLSDKAKMRALQKLYDKGVSIKRPRAVTVVGRKGAMGKKGTKIVDKRMKKDHPAQIRPGNRCGKTN